MQQLRLFGIYDTTWLITECTKAMTISEREIFNATIMYLKQGSIK